MDDGSGRVDWEKVQAIYVVLGYGLRMLSERVPGTMSSSLTWGMGFNGDAGEEMVSSEFSRCSDQANFLSVARTWSWVIS